MLDEPNLPLAPHEIPIGFDFDPIYPPFLFRTVWDGRERELRGQVLNSELGDLTFFQLVEEPEQGNFVSAWTPPCHNWRLPKPLAFEPRFHSPMSDPATTLAREADYSWGRVFFLDENLEVAGPQNAKRRLFLSQDGGGEWRQQRYFPQKGSPFIWASPETARQKARLAPLQLLEHFLDLLREPNNDAAQALEWEDLPHQERSQICRPLTRGTYSEWRDVLALFMRSRAQIWAEDDSAWHMAHNLLVWPTQRNSWEEYFRFERFYNWLQSYFEPSLDVALSKRCTAADVWSRERVLVSAQVFRPTQHERLEALLQLRDWLSDKATPAEIELLLRAE